MADERKSILVIGATGSQGGAVVRHLLARDDEFQVHGLTRDNASERAEKLSERGVVMLEGDLDDPDSLRRVMEGMHGVFCVTNFWQTGYDRQVQQGKNAADVASELGVEHFVFSGVGDHDQSTGIPHFDSCWEIDQHIQQLDLATTVLKPVFFFQNFEGMSDDITDGTLALGLKQGVKLQMIDVDDIGKAATVAFLNPDEFIGTRHNLAGDSKTVEQAAHVFSNVLDIEVEPVHVPMDALREQMGEEFAVMFEWFNEHGYTTDLQECEETFGFEFTNLRDYLHKHGWHVVNTGGQGLRP
ncbi:NmrA/HSCARG family protein [Persicimonas caeni]|uniref:NmrA/HSCARG family protein n=1 Tax=Persicimonas caeni TaxID=2292766 RepID=A0A4Y6PP53_PERCE|nr:NmrA/HSCARG family protein [Persicimonas caeni]QDG50102.1 NmrA/HSCARG family protein [Persicimonas caeni]QED31323.1 NmrA/HSCARG family protein [Persicimonas caeni]